MNISLHDILTRQAEVFERETGRETFSHDDEINAPWVVGGKCIFFGVDGTLIMQEALHETIEDRILPPVTTRTTEEGSRSSSITTWLEILQVISYRGFPKLCKMINIASMVQVTKNRPKSVSSYKISKVYKLSKFQVRQT